MSSTVSAYRQTYLCPFRSFQFLGVWIPDENKKKKRVIYHICVKDIPVTLKEESICIYCVYSCIDLEQEVMYEMSVFYRSISSISGTSYIYMFISTFVRNDVMWQGVFLTKHHQTFLKCGWIEDETNLCRDVGGHFQALDEVPLIRLNDMTLKSPWNNMPKQVDLYVFLMKRRVWHATACCIGTDTKSRT